VISVGYAKIFLIKTWLDKHKYISLDWFFV